MNAYTIYNSDGEIVSIFIGSDDDLALNVAPGHAYISGQYSSDEYKIVDGAPVAKTDQERLVPIEEAWAVLRDMRNIELSLSDWTQAIDSPLTDAEKQAWQTYRSTLRSLPENTVDPRNPTWPEKPS